SKFASALTRFEQDFESLVQRSERHKELVEDEVQAAEIGQSHKVRTGNLPLSLVNR
ncbi:MAG: hypothetical protein M1830_003113, partial [Pleopsidium flavum]